jgi:hypothetical protein
MDGKVWFPIAAPAGPKPTAYHSSVIMGDYMLSFGKLFPQHIILQLFIMGDYMLSYGKLFPQLCLKSRR